MIYNSCINNRNNSQKWVNYRNNFLIIYSKIKIIDILYKNKYNIYNNNKVINKIINKITKNKRNRYKKQKKKLNTYINN